MLNYLRSTDSSHQFPLVRPKMSSTAKALLITGVALAAVAGLSMLAVPVGTIGFYLSAGGMALGVALVLGELMGYYPSSETHCAEIPSAESSNDETLMEQFLRFIDDDYRNLLEIDQGKLHELKFQNVMNFHELGWIGGFKRVDNIHYHHEINQGKFHEIKLPNLPNNQGLYIGKFEKELASQNPENLKNKNICLLNGHPYVYHAGEPDQNLCAQNTNDLERGNIYLLNGRPFSLVNTDFRNEVQEIVNNTQLTDQIIAWSEDERDPERFKKLMGEITTADNIELINNSYFKNRVNEIPNQVPKKLHPYLNQSIVADILCPMVDKYWNGDLVAIGANPDAYSMLVNFDLDKGYVYVRTMLQFSIPQESTYFPLYLAPELKLDLETRVATLSWTSPQTTPPDA